MENDVVVNANVVVALSVFIEDQETRPYLNGIFVTPASSGGVVCVATNGQSLAIIRDPRGSANGEWILPIRGCLEGALGGPFYPMLSPGCVQMHGPVVDYHMGVLHFLEGKVHLYDRSFWVGDAKVSSEGPILTCNAQPLSGKFPDWRKVLSPNDWTPCRRARSSCAPINLAAHETALMLLTEAHHPLEAFSIESAKKEEEHDDTGTVLGPKLVLRTPEVPDYFGVIAERRLSKDPGDILPPFVRDALGEVIDG